MGERQPIGRINRLVRIGVIAGSLFVAERLNAETASAQNVTPIATPTPLVDDIARIRVLSEATAMVYEKTELAKIISTAQANQEYSRVATIVISRRYNELMATPEPQKAAILEEAEGKARESLKFKNISDSVGFILNLVLCGFGGFAIADFIADRTLKRRY